MRETARDVEIFSDATRAALSDALEAKPPHRDVAIRKAMIRLHDEARAAGESSATVAAFIQRIKSLLPRENGDCPDEHDAGVRHLLAAYFDVP